MNIPDFALVLLLGAPGAGKAAFAARHFNADERQGWPEERLRERRLSVVVAEAPNAAERQDWVRLARRWHAPLVAIALDPGVEACLAALRARGVDETGAKQLRHVIGELHRALPKLESEGFAQVWRLQSGAAIAETRVERIALPADRRDETGPFDIIGDVHGCADELETLLAGLGYAVSWTGEGAGRAVRVVAPAGRKAVFLGDLVDRGPRIADVLRIAMAMVSAGDALCVISNHDDKLARWMAGRDVVVAHGLGETVEQLSRENEAFRAEVKAFIEGLPSHLWLDGGRLAVVHAGLKPGMIGRESKAVRGFAMYGQTTGEIDGFGLPVRRNWAAAYRGQTAIVYGHTASREAVWLNNTICIDTGCVHGGALTALRWPERELLSVPAARVYYVTSRNRAAV